ncbi:hypothetical protein [Vagococcus intermedius]|uniref:Uncharacterized protein n=1 Tax=Vagococcus intermedius TaxID=2991418 RepID=A0AAF0CX31_9ENTE|nr:hypothetical protein [Vagococcus intermedius]WEG74388.1 hypothetical protein OL234_10510 [Vagococcus intermedius]WEG76509.1 hypothetical protein OL235_10685 [Vagococcus intermedius]
MFRQRRLLAYLILILVGMIAGKLIPTGSIVIISILLAMSLGGALEYRYQNLKYEKITRYEDNEVNLEKIIE